MISDESVDKPKVLTEEEINKMYAPPKSFLSKCNILPSLVHQIRSMFAISRKIHFILDEDGGWATVEQGFFWFFSEDPDRQKDNIGINTTMASDDYLIGVDLEMYRKTDEQQFKRLFKIFFPSTISAEEIRKRMKELLSTS